MPRGTSAWLRQILKNKFGNFQWQPVSRGFPFFGASAQFSRTSRICHCLISPNPRRSVGYVLLRSSRSRTLLFLELDGGLRILKHANQKPDSFSDSEEITQKITQKIAQKITQEPVTLFSETIDSLECYAPLVMRTPNGYCPRCSLRYSRIVEGLGRRQDKEGRGDKMH